MHLAWLLCGGWINIAPASGGQPPWYKQRTPLGSSSGHPLVLCSTRQEVEVHMSIRIYPVYMRADLTCQIWQDALGIQMQLRGALSVVYDEKAQPRVPKHGQASQILCDF